MPLTAAQTKRIRNEFVDSLAGDVCEFTKAEIEAAITAVDTWMTDNTAAFIAALPLPFRTTSKVAQKRALLALVVMARHQG